MRTSGLVVAIGLVLVGSTAQAGAGKGSSRHRAKRPVEAAPATPADADAEGSATAQTDAKQVALETRETTGDGGEDSDAGKHAKVVKVEPGPVKPGWHVAIGPYLWASSVTARSLGGPVSTGVDIGFIPLERHARYGVPLVGEVRHGRFALYGDLMYAVIGVNGSSSVASVMVQLDGNASSLMIDGAAGYQVLGDDDAVFSLEARAGVRYQRTAIDGAVRFEGITVQAPDTVNDGSDVLAGARAVLRPTRWLFLSGVFDYGVAGVSDRTWSASADLSLRVWSHLLVTAGWRTLTMERTSIGLALHGPRVAAQFVF